MANIITREVGATAKGTTLSNAELDNNFINLNNELSTKANTASPTFTGVAQTPKLEVTGSAGDEGGEIFLNKAQTNTTLIGGVTLDVYQNKLRIFEVGGNNRGVFIDLSSAASGVDTNLLVNAPIVAADIPGLDASKITSGTISADRLPSYVDDVVEAASLAAFPAIGETGKIYVALDTNKTYRWSGSAYIYITSGAVDSVAGKTGVVTLTNSDVGLGSVENKSSATIRSELTSGNVTGALGFTPYNSTNPSGFISGINSSMVTAALGFTPYNSSNPSGYITSSALSSYLPLSGGTISGNVVSNGGFAASGLYNQAYFQAADANNFWITPGNVPWGLYFETSGGGLLGGSGDSNRLGFVGSSTARFWVDLNNGDGWFGGSLSIAGNQALHAGNSTSYPSAYAPLLSAVGSYSFSASTNGRDFAAGVQAGFVSNGQGYPSYGSVVRVKTYSNDGGTAELYFPYSSTYGGSGMRYRMGQYDNAGWTDWKTILDSSNYSSYALPLSGGTISGPTYISSGGNYPLNLISTQRYMLQLRNSNNSINANYGWWLATDTNFDFVLHADGFGDRLTLGRSNNVLSLGGNQVLHAGNYNSYAPTLTGGGASGTWGINVTGTANNITAYTINQNLGTSNQVTFDSIITNNNGNGTNIKLGDDVWLGDCNLANTFRIRGSQDASAGYIVFGSDTTQLGRTGATALAWGGNAVLHAGNYSNYALPLGGKAADSDLLDGYNSDRFFRTYSDSIMESGVHGGSLNGTNMQYLLAREQVQNHLAFRAPTSYEIWNGSAWVSQTVPTSIFRNKPSSTWDGLTVANGTTKVRFTWLSFGYKFWSTLATSGSTNGNAFRARIYTSSDNVTWTERWVSGYVGDWPGYHVWPTYYGDGSQPHMRIELEFSWNNGNACSFGDIALWGAYGGYTPLFDWDYYRNITLGGDLQLSDKFLRFDQSGTRSWNVRATGGNLDVASGDGLGSLRYNGNAVLTAGNYSSYALPLSGGELTGPLMVTTTTANSTYVASRATLADGSVHAMKTVAGGVFEAIRAMNMDTTAGTTVRLVAASTSDPFNNTNGGKVFIDAVRSATNMDLVFSLNDVAGAAPVERFRFFGSGAFNAIGAITQNGNQVLHAGNFSSYAPSISGGSTIGGITYFSNGESMQLYGIRGRFSNEFIHLYNKVGIGNPSGWGVGETSTPDQGLSTYGGLNVAYGTGAQSTFNGSTLFYRNNPAIHNGSYLVGENHIELRTNNGSNPALGFHRSGYTAVTLYHDDNNSLRLHDANTGNDSLMLHSGNYSSYALPLSGGTLSGRTSVSFSGQSAPSNTSILGTSLFNWTGGGGDYLTLGQYTNSAFWLQSSYYNPSLAYYPIYLNPLGGSVLVGSSVVLHAGNYNNYALPLSGGTVSGYTTFSADVNMTSTNSYLPGHFYTNTWDGSNVYFHVGGSGSTTNKILNLRVMNSSGGNSLYQFDVNKLNAPNLQINGNQVLHAGNSQEYRSRSLNAVRTTNVNFNSLNTAVDTFTAGTNYIPYGGAYNQPADGDHHYLSWGGIEGQNVWGAQIDINFYDDRMWFRRQHGPDWQAWRNVLHDGNYSSYALPLSGGTLTGDLTLSGNNTWFGGSTYLRSNTAFSFLTNSGGAQNGRFNGIQVSDSYDGSVPTNGILFGTDTTLVRDGAYQLSLSGNRVLHAGNYTNYEYTRLANVNSNPDNSHPGYGIRPFYSWNIGSANNASSGYANGISIGSHPSDPNYGFQIVQNMWDDQLYFRRYNYGWQSWRTALDNSNYSNYALPLSGGTLTGSRPIWLDTNGGGIQIKGDSGGWGMGLYFKGTDDVIKGSFGALGGGSSFSYLWAGVAYNDTWMTWNSSDINAKKPITLGGRINSSTFGGNTSGMSGHVFPAEVRANGAKPTLTWHYEDVATRHIALDADGALNVYNPNESGGAVFKVGGNIALHAGNYSSYALPLSGGTLSGDITFSNGRKGLVGVYDATQTQAIFAMGSSYKLQDGGSSSSYGNFYGLGWSYNPDYGGAGNNPQSKAGLSHQLLLMMAGTTRTAIGTGIWTDGTITATGGVAASGAITQGGNQVLHAGNYNSYALPLSGGTITGSLTVSSGNTTGGGIILADDGDIVDLNDAYCSMRFSYGVRVFSENKGGSAVHTLHSNGTFTASGNITAYSDERLKKDWTPLVSDFVERLAAIKSGTYTRIDNNKRQAGSSAQDWQQLLPEVVTEADNEEKTLSLAYGNAALVSAIELAKDNVELRARIERLESLIEQLLNKE